MFKDKLSRLKLLLNSNNLNLNYIRNEIDYLSNFVEYNEYEYLNKLLYPEKDRNAKIPSKVPIPTTSFRYNFTEVLTTNSSGTCFILFNPYFLANDTFFEKNKIPYEYEKLVGDNITIVRRWLFTTKFFSTYWVNNKPALTGEADMYPQANIVFPRDAQQVINNIYSKYRLVSGYFDVRYIDTIESASGVIGGAITNECFPCIGTRYQPVTSEDATFNPDAANYPSYPTTSMMKYGNFNVIRQLPYSKENSILEGIRMVYYPLDNFYSEFVPIYNCSETKVDTFYDPEDNVPTFLVESSSLKSSFNWLCYTQNAPPYAKIKVTVCCNFECLLDPTYMDYIPTSTCYGAIPTNVFYETLKNIKLKAII